MLAEIQLRRHFDAVRSAHVRQSHGAEQDSIAFAYTAKCRGRQWISAAQKLARAGREFLKLEAVTRDRLFGAPENAHALRDHLRSDTVAGEHRDPQRSHPKVTTVP